MKSYTYASLATIVFLKHKTSVSRSIESVIRSSDALARQLGMDPDLSHMTKYRIIIELQTSNILTLQSETGRKKLRLSTEIVRYMQEN
jgi:hypothetical protein